MEREKLLNLGKLLLKLGITSLLIYLVVQQIDFGKLKQMFLQSNLLYIALAFLTYLISLSIGCWRNLDFLNSIGLNIKYAFNAKLYMLGLFYNVSLPGGVGGDGYKIYILRKKYQLPTKRIFLAMLFDRLSGLWAIGVIAVSLIILIPKIELPAHWPLTALFAGTAIYYFIMRRYFPDYAAVFMRTHFKAILVQSLQAGSVILLLLSQNFEGKFSPYLFSFLLSTLAANVPLSLGGLGAREYAMLHASNFFGMDYSLAVFLTTTFFLIGTGCALTGLYFVYNSKEFAPVPSETEALEFEQQADAKIGDK